MIKRIIPWTSQPQIPVEIDRSNPLAVPFTSFLYPATGGKLFDACASPLQNSVSTTITPGVFVGGRNFEFNGTTSGVNFGDVETVNFAGAYSIFVLFRPDAQSGARREMLLAKDVLGGRQFSVELNPKGASGSAVGQTGSIGHTRWSSGAAFYQKYSNANVVANGNWYSLLIGSTDGSTDIVAYLDGANLSLSAGSGSATGLVVNTTTALTAGRRAYVGAEDYFDGGIAAIGIANVAPSVSLAKALYENPYQLLKKQQRNIYVSVAGGGLSASLGQPSETDTVSALTSAKAQSVGLISATDTAQGITSGKAGSLGLITSTETAQSLTAAKSSAIGLAAETDSPFTISSIKSVSAALVTETETAQPLTSIKYAELGQASETEESLALVSSATSNLGLIAETDTVFAITAIKTAALGFPSESDSALSVSASKTAMLGLVTEIEYPLPLVSSASSAVGQVVETDTAFAINVAKLAGIGYPTETDSAPSVSAAKMVTLGLVTETGYVFALTSADEWAGEPFNFASPITRTFDFTSSITKNLNFESPI